MSTATPSKTLAFFGPTGGCANAALVLSLGSGHFCSALSRTPSKLTEMLASKGVTQAVMDSKLRIVQGDARDEAALRAVIAPASLTAGIITDKAYAHNSRNTASVIISGIGMDPFAKQWDTTICQDYSATLAKALASLDDAAAAPFVTAISTTGISNGPRDVPLPLVPLYHVGLKAAHADKRIMEANLLEAKTAGTARGVCLVRPTLLGGSKEKGIGAIRAGSENKPQMGYLISRLDVGRWIFEECVVGDEARWNGEKVSLAT